ncbi:hypothetical protein W02_08850 [Nitrospira sp. KM1]|uniref:HEAT repeat domain-containing protein n=1 Tax=Nitrospira sp. KM1 TaxID=1936990 RepID=UPI0013A7B2C9|nr:HEAT repeat domain-containing protein [Nitrospira sp. KM1]BCA53745.1 hypothetical protein W02_08850 [Nitrospira sp. KM1]
MHGVRQDVAVTQPLSFALVFILMALPTLPAMAEDLPSDVGSRHELVPSDQRTIYLNVDATSYRTRGRVSFGFVPTLKSKLAAYGYTATLEHDARHALTLTIQYRETRGQQISLDLYGTDISCAMILSGLEKDHLLDLAVRESPDYAGMITAPYVEVVDKFQSNPYFYFLPDLIQASTTSGLDATAGLIAALERALYSAKPAATPLDTLVSPAETFSDMDDHFSSAASQRTIEELGRLQDRRATDLLIKLTGHPDHAIRLAAVRALENFSVPAISAVITQVAQEDTDVSVREAAKAALNWLPASVGHEHQR